MRQRRGPVSRLWMLVRAFWKHRKYASAMFWFTLGPPMMAMTRLMLALDYVFYPELRSLEIDRPVLILGHPRSGTTFLQRQIYGSHTAGMFTTWELLFPSLVQRRILSPFVWALNKMDLGIVQTSEYGHEIRIAGVEEDEGIFIHRLDTEILTLNCPWLLTDPEFCETGFRLGWLSRWERRTSARFYREILKRQVIATGHNRLVLKCNVSVFRLREILETFPDIRIVYVVRAPDAALQSYLAFAHRFAAPLLNDAELRDYTVRKYEWSCALYRTFERLRGCIPEDQLLVVTFEEISQRISDTLNRFFTFADLAPSDRFWREFAKRRSSRHRKRHVNEPLEAFGITSAEVRREFAFVWDRYLEPEPTPTESPRPDRDNAPAGAP
ncbi:MAG: sulfotransferase [Spirochaetota bacterium]